MEDIKKQMQVDLTDVPWVSCAGGNYLWDSSMMIKRISPILSPSGREEIIPAEIVICKTCGKVPKFFWEKMKDIPASLKSTCDEQK